MNRERYENHLTLVADSPAMLRAVDVPRLIDEIPPSFDPHDFLCWLAEQPVPARALAAIEEARAAATLPELQVDVSGDYIYLASADRTIAKMANTDAMGCTNDDYTTEHALAHADSIARACNSHDQQLGALQLVAERIEETYLHDDDGNRIDGDAPISGADFVDRMLHIESVIAAAIEEATK